MNRREFLCCVGKCGCAMAIAGCAVTQDPKKETARLNDQSRKKSIDKTDWDVSVCGLNCARCKLFESGQCKGCRGPLDKHWSPNCEFLPCSKARGHRYCFQCGEFPCKKLQMFAADGHEHHRLAVENMKKMKKIGLEKWIAEQQKPMFCSGWLF